MKNSFNTKIAKYFLENTRLTFLCFFLLVFLGVGSTLLLKTTGFPSPEINFAFVQVLYPGASSESILSDVTRPLESAIKEVDGIESYTSNSQNSFVVFEMTIESDADQARVIADLNAAISGVDFPSEVNAPSVIVPDIAGPDFIYSIAGGTMRDLFEYFQEIEYELFELDDTLDVNAIEAIEREVVIHLQEDEMLGFGVTEMQVVERLSALGMSLPVAANIEIDGNNTSIVASTPELSLRNLKDVPFGDHKLSDFAVVSTRYFFENEQKAVIGFEGERMLALTFEIYISEDADSAEYLEEIETVFERQEDVLIVKNYSVHDENTRQVNEVLGGLIGGELNIDNPLKYLGYLLGGIQLVFLVMMLFVSFRAASIAALSIPLGLVFSTIYVFLSGNNLNTMVLFSLVLVIGLVVDPALVTLESLQRKIDTGKRGKEAALDAIRDVGDGLFLATLTNIIVFFPFAVVSGLLGSIIKYIPLTIMPAVAGSYIVPLIFLAWLGSIFLKEKRNSSEDEAGNMWLVAKWLNKFNYSLLNGSKILRAIIIFVAGVLPFVLTASLFSSGAIKSVQFAGSQNADLMLLQGTFFSNASIEEKEELSADVMDLLLEEDQIQQISPMFGMGGFSYLVTLYPAAEREEISVDIASRLNEDLQKDFGGFFFDVNLDLLSNGPPESNYQIAIAIESDDLDVLENSAKDVGISLSHLCLDEDANEYSIDKDCEATSLVTKVDDGYTNRVNDLIDVQIDYDNLDATFAIYGQLDELFNPDGDVIASITLDGDETDVVFDKPDESPDTLREISGSEIYLPSGEQVKVHEVGHIEKSSAKQRIQRVNGATVAVVQARLDVDHNDQATAAFATQALIDYYAEDDGERSLALGLKADSVELYTEGSLAGFTKSFQELFLALILAIFLSYLVLAVFFESFTLPLVILFTIPLTFFGVFPALVLWGNGEFGFLEIIGLIILIGIVENVAIFLIDSARQKIAEGMDEIEAIAFASAIRLRPVLLTTLTSVASLAPLAVMSEQYRSMAIVIMFGLISSGITSLFTTPILFVFFRWLSSKVRRA